MNNETEPHYDVVIYEIATKKIDTIAGEDMRLSAGFHNAEKRYETVSPRLNDDYSPCIIPTGKYKKGDIITQQDIDNQP